MSVLVVSREILGGSRTDRWLLWSHKGDVRKVLMAGTYEACVANMHSRAFKNN